LSNIFKLLLIFCIGGPGFIVWGCAPVISIPSSQTRWNRDIQTGETGSAPEKPSPRAVASLQLTDQGRRLLENGNPDDAIGVFEQAINLDPINGQNYYYLSEAWLVKENIVQAVEFNRLAAIYLEDDEEWLNKVMLQKERIIRSSR
jgi:tetratricopeptide (TPR) repeat protein